MGHPQMSNIVASHPQATQLPGSVWVTLPVPSCLNTSAPSLRPFSRGKLSFSALLQAQPLSLPSFAFLPTAQSGNPLAQSTGQAPCDQNLSKRRLDSDTIAPEWPRLPLQKVLLCSSAWSPRGTHHPNQVSTELGLPGACHWPSLPLEQMLPCVTC